MKDLLGLGVLTSPLWLILLVLVLGLVAASRVAKRTKSGGAKLAGTVAILAGAFLILFGDELAGRAYLNYLCTTKAGVKVYHTVELPAEYWDDEGKPKFYDEENGNFTLQGYRIDYRHETFSSFFRIDNAGYRRLDESGRVLGEVTNFIYWGGWVRRNFTTHNTATACDGRRERSNELINHIFRRDS